MKKLAPATIALGLALASASCSGGDVASKDEASDDGTDSDEAPPLGVDDAVPMSLVGTAFLPGMVDRLRENVVTRAPGADPRATTGSPFDADGFAIARSILRAPQRAAGEMTQLVSEVQSLVDAVFSPVGYFGERPVLLGPQVSSRRFDLGGRGGLKFAEVRRTEASAAYRFEAKLYRPADAAHVELATLVAFSPSSEGGSASIRIVHRSAPQAPGGPAEIVELEYDTARRSLYAVYGPATPLPSRPAVTALTLERDDAASRHVVTGLYRWERDGFAGALVPRHYDPRRGDIEAFVLAGSSAATGEAAQRMAFVPAPDAPSMAWRPAAAAFESWAVSRQTRAFLAELLRVEAYNPTCATSGNALRAAFGQTPPPASVAALPDSLCREAGPTSDAAVTGAVADACGAGVAVSIRVRDPRVAGETLVDVCRFVDEGKLLDNPQIAALEGGVPTILRPGDKTAVHDALLRAVDQKELPDPAAVVGKTFAVEPPRAIAEFGDALWRPLRRSSRNLRPERPPAPCTRGGRGLLARLRSCLARRRLPRSTCRRS